MALTVVGGLICAIVAILKGRPVLAVLGMFLPFVGPVAALRLARPSSWWARRRYGTRRMVRSRRRFPVGRRSRWDSLVDLFAATPPVADRGDR